MALRCLIVASGPSVEGVYIPDLPGVHIIAVNGAVEWLPRVDSFFSLDPGRRVQQLCRDRREGTRYYLAVPDDFGTYRAKAPVHRNPRIDGVTYLRRVTGDGYKGCAYGLSEDLCEINTGNSAYGALGLAYLMGATHIALLGVDATDSGYAYNHGGPAWSLSHVPGLFATAIPQLERRGIMVVNGSSNSNVRCFPRCTPEEAIRWIDEVGQAR